MVTRSKPSPNRGQRVTLKNLDTPVTLSWFWRRHQDTGEREQHFVVATEALSGAYIVRLGKRRWAIEACFKVLKHQFGWDAFGAGTLLGMYRWWILAFISYLLSHWQALAHEASPIDWQQAAHGSPETNSFLRRFWRAFYTIWKIFEPYWQNWVSLSALIVSLSQYETGF